MSHVPDTFVRTASRQLPLLLAADPHRVLAWRHGRAISARQFLQHARAVAAMLPPAEAVVSLCTDRYAFMVAFCAAMLRGQVTLLPSSRAPRAVDEVMATHPGCYAFGNEALDPAPPGYWRLPDLDHLPAVEEEWEWPDIPADQVVAIGYTSGSTALPHPSPKTWGSLHASNAGNLGILSAAVQGSFSIVATVPPQHMYGVEMSVLLPLLGGHSVHCGRPLFPADVAAALAGIPAPRVLVSTPVHLRALIESGVCLPPVELIISATAPLSVALARAVEDGFAAPVQEVFGSTETCVFASRRPTVSEDWQLYPDVTLQAQPDGTAVCAPQLSCAVTLADIVSIAANGRSFTLSGRRADLLEIAGKRASLSDLTRRLLAVPGVRDGVVLQLDERDALGVQRIAAVAVAPELDATEIIEALRRSIDPVFLPRPLRLVKALPRNETGKLPRSALLALLAECKV